MEEFAWILMFAVVWLLSAIGEARKSKKKPPVEEKRHRARRPERRAQTGPAATRRGLASDIEEGARRAEQALRRWEARQSAPSMQEQRREAYAAITDLLADGEIGAQGDLATPQPAAPGPLAPTAPIGRGAAGGGARPASPASGLSRLDRLPILQRAIVLRELLGPPKALSPGSDLP